MKNSINFYEKGSVEILHGKSTHCFPLHSHESFCVGVIKKGEALFNINNKKKVLKENMIFIVPSNTGISINADCEYNYITICFKNELKKLVENIHFNKYFIEMNLGDDILLLCDIFKRNNDEDEFLNSILKIISSAINKDFSLQRDKTYETVLSVSEYIKKHASDKFDLDELAKTFYLSKYHLIRTFKKEMGVTPNQYYLQEKMRIIKAEIFKIKSETDLAVKLNLSDQSHLCKLFKKQMGISIQDYRKNFIRK
jgi:AraC-like DNA-binding protein